jgi:hypothetical protein
MRTKLNNIFHNPGGRWLASLLLILGMVGSAAAILDILSFPGGFTSSRVVLLIIPVMTGLLCVWFIVKVNRNWKDSLRRITGWVANPRLARFMDTAVPMLWVALLVVAFLSPDGLGRWNAVYDRINGLLQLAFLYVTKIWIFWLSQKKQYTFLADKSNRPAILAGLILTGLIALAAVFIACTGMGIGPGTQYWGKSGIPVLHWQVGGALVVMAALFLLDRRFSNGKPARVKDLAVFVLLWLAAFLLWQSIPTPVSRFVTASYPPNYTGYPYSDAGDYALEGQMILSGNGFPYGFLDKPFHLTLLAVISWLAGSDYARMMLLQTGLMALIPGLIYLLVSKISYRPAGITAATVVLFMQANNLAIADHVQATNVKMAMSEPLTSLLLILFALSVVDWWKAPNRSWLHAAVSGALLGLTALVRLNVLVIVPFVLLVWLFAFNIRSRRTWCAALVFVIFCVLGQIPWTMRNQVVNGNAIDSYMSKVLGVVIKERINPIVDIVHVEKTPAPGTEQPVGTPSTGEPAARPNDWRTLTDSFVRTGLHNLTAVGLSLPASIYHEGLDETIRHPYWDQEWNGTFTPYGQIMLAISLLAVALGFAASWKRSGVISLIPLLILLSYLLSNSVSMVSGGRYIVPVDWVLPSYFSMGMAGLTVWLFGLKPGQTAVPVDAPIYNKWLWLQLVLILAAACLPMSLSLFIPKEFKPADNAAVLSEIKSLNPEWPAGYSSNDLEKLIASPDASFKAGRVIFPRWMKTGEGDTAGRGSAFSALSFDHLSFSVISDDEYPFDAVLPVDAAVDPLPNASKVILAGCKTDAYFDTAVMIVLEPSPKTYIRKDPGSFTCPLPQP